MVVAHEGDGWKLVADPAGTMGLDSAKAESNHSIPRPRSRRPGLAAVVPIPVPTVPVIAAPAVVLAALITPLLEAFITKPHPGAKVVGRIAAHNFPVISVRPVG